MSAKRSRSPWSELQTDIQPIMNRLKTKHLPRKKVKESVETAMRKLWPEDDIHANKCTEEVLFIKSLALNLVRDESQFIRVDEALHHMGKMIDPSKIITQLKMILFDLFKKAIGTVCVSLGPDTIIWSGIMAEEPGANLVLYTNMMISAIIEAYEKSFHELTKKDLRQLMKQGEDHFKSNCDILISVIRHLKYNGIELNGACSLPNGG